MYDRLAAAELIFQEALDLGQQSREELLRTRCAGDGALRTLVERLLANDSSDMGNFLRTPAFQPAAHPGVTPNPLRIGPYEVVRPIGAGGMGIVYEARQPNPQRTVAVKLLRSPLPTRAALERFTREAEILALLNHPGLVHVYEAAVGRVALPGGHAIAQPYIVMEFVAGQTLIEFAGSRRLGVRARLDLIALVCDAVQYAHQRGIIHRDLKADNILVNEAGQPKVLDFGVARLTAPDACPPDATRTREIVGTLAYLSPEQAAGDPLLDTRSDVYSLGVIAYELLAGQLPYDLRGVPVAEVLRRISQSPPAPLSTCSPRLRGDVETIVGKALQKDCARRYASAAALASDVRRHLRGEAIEARRNSKLYVLGRTLRRFRWAFAAGFILVAGLLAFAAYASVQADSSRRMVEREREARQWAEAATARANAARVAEIEQRGRAEAASRTAETAQHAEAEARQRAESEAAHARSVTDFLVEMLGLTDPDVSQRSDLTVREVLERASLELDGGFELRPEAEAALRTVIGKAYSASGEPEAARLHLERALRLREMLPEVTPAELYEVMWPLTYVLQDLSDTLADRRALLCGRMGRRCLVGLSPELAARCDDLLGMARAAYAEDRAAVLRAEVDALARAALPAGDDRWVLVGDQFQLCGLFLLPRQHPDAACAHFEDALAIYRSVLPETNTRIVRTLGLLLNARLGAGQFADAELVAHESLRLVKATLAPDHWYVALCRARLGASYLGQGRWPEAEALLLEGYDKVVAARGTAGRYASELQRYLIGLEVSRGCTECAERRRVALAAAMAGSPEDSSWTASATSANAAREAFGSAEGPLMDALDRTRTALRSGDAELLEALPEAIRLRRALLPDDHPLAALIADACINWAAYDVSPDVPADMLLEFGRELANLARAAPALYPRKRAYVLAQVGILHRKQGQLAAAEAHLREALGILESGYGTYAFTDWAQAQLGVVLAMQQRPGEAEPLLRSGYEGLRAYGGATTVDTRGALSHLLRLYQDTGQVERFGEIATRDALDLLAAPEAEPKELYGAAWRIARSSEFAPACYPAALAAAERAAAMRPASDSAQRALGAALYRAERFPEAIDALLAAEQLSGKTRRGCQPSDRAFIAMAFARLGNLAAARDSLEQARRLMSDAALATRWHRTLLEEAEAVVGSLASRGT